VIILQQRKWQDFVTAFRSNIIQNPFQTRTVSCRDDNQVKVYDTESFSEIATLPADKPSGIFFTPRAHRIGQ